LKTTQQGYRRGRTILWASLAVAAIALTLLGVNRSAARSGLVIRFIDQMALDSSRQVTIDDTTRRVLPPARRRQVIPLERIPSKPILRFSAGLAPGEPAVTVRFRVLLRLRDGSLRRLYDRELAVPGWHHEQLDLDGFDLTGAALLLKRNVVDKTLRREVIRGVWGEPMLLSATPAMRDSVVLVSIDTLRADRVGAYGSSEGLTPALDELAQTATLYEHAYSPSTWTLPSHFSMFRGVQPRSAPSGGKEIEASLAADTTPLVTVFRDAGYLTAAFTGGGYVSYPWGFSEGFDSYHSYQQSSSTRVRCPPERFDGPEVLRRTREWLRENGDRPFFLFVHTYDAHDRCPLRRPGRGEKRWDSSPQGQQRMSALYDEMVTKADGILNGVLAELAALQDRRITIAVTSDHGEALWEHGYFGHGCTSRPYDPVVRVPLIIRPASNHDGAKRITAPVSVASVAPTLLALADLSLPERMELPVLPGLNLDAGRRVGPVYASCGDQLAVRKGRYKLISTRDESRSDEVYDLESDPGEINNLAFANPELTAELRELATRYWQHITEENTSTPVEEPVLDDVTRDRLRALGYLE
jgi:arylsulfatase A-like enzyme